MAKLLQEQQYRARARTRQLRRHLCYGSAHLSFFWLKEKFICKSMMLLPSFFLSTRPLFHVGKKCRAGDRNWSLFCLRHVCLCENDFFTCSQPHLPLSLHPFQDDRLDGSQSPQHLSTPYGHARIARPFRRGSPRVSPSNSSWQGQNIHEIRERGGNPAGGDHRRWTRSRMPPSQWLGTFLC